MKLLILGGTRFVGRVLAEEALQRGHEVSSFNRGRTGADVAGIELIRGDRERPADLERLWEGRSWDAVIDTSGYVPGVVGGNARALAGHAGRYVFVSTVSVYADWPHAGVSEDSPPQECSPEVRDSAADRPNWPHGRYGAYKAGCERALGEVFGEELLILRPGVVLGPREDVGRLPWWLTRSARGGWMLAPGDPCRGMQPIDVQDLAAFALNRVEQGRGGRIRERGIWPRSGRPRRG